MTFPVTYLLFSPPPPLNNLYADKRGGGRTRSIRYRTWQQAILNDLRDQKAKPFGSPCIVSLSMPDKYTGDIDNRLKAALDILVEAKVLEGDDKRYVREVRAKWVPAWMPCQVALWATNE